MCLSVDPMHSERSWLTPYNYVQNNPVNLIDPTGMIDSEPDPMKTVDLKPVDIKPKKSLFSRAWDSVKSFLSLNWMDGFQMYGTSQEQGVAHRDGNATGDPIDLTETLEMLDALLYRKDSFRFKPNTKPNGGEVKGKALAEAINPSITEAVGIPGLPTPEVPANPKVGQPETLSVRYWEHGSNASRLIIKDTVVPPSLRGDFDRGMDSIRENQNGVFGKVYIYKK